MKYRAENTDFSLLIFTIGFTVMRQRPYSLDEAKKDIA